IFSSSRRRHTRFSRDWSSDVCSSDLEEIETWTEEQMDDEILSICEVNLIDYALERLTEVDGLEFVPKKELVTIATCGYSQGDYRSEERRVGKETSDRCASTESRRTSH